MLPHEIGALLLRMGRFASWPALDNPTLTATSPRLDPRLRDAAAHLDDRQQPVAETWRRVGLLADELGLPRPGYDTIRLIVREHRRRLDEVRTLLEPVIADLLQGRVSPWDVERVIDAARAASGR